MLFERVVLIIRLTLLKIIILNHVEILMIVCNLTITNLEASLIAGVAEIVKRARNRISLKEWEH